MSLTYLNSNISFRKFVVVSIETDELYNLNERFNKVKMNSLLNSLGDILETVLKGNNYILGYINDGEYCLIMDFEQSRGLMSINAKIFEICEKVREYVKNYLNIQVSVGISSICEEFESVSDCYKQAKIAIDGKIYLGGNRIIHFSEMENYTGMLGKYLTKFEGEIIHVIFESQSKNERHFQNFILFL
jgi:two-component system response regulator YesN